MGKWTGSARVSRFRKTTASANIYCDVRNVFLFECEGRLFTTRTENHTEHWRRHERTTTDVVVRRGHPRAPRVREGGTAAGTRLAPSGLAPARFRPPRPSRTRVPRSHLTALLLSHALLLRQTASTHLREGLLALCPGGGDAATLHDIIEACDAEHRRLGGDLANATDEDVRLFALFSTAATHSSITWRRVP